MTTEDELRAELQRVNDAIDAAYWAFTRQARARPPVLAVPEAYRRRSEIMALLAQPPPAPLRALTLWEPWASALVLGPKDIENRPWAPPSSIIGQWVLIHAGQTWDAARALDVMEVWEVEQVSTLPNAFRTAIINHHDRGVGAPRRRPGDRRLRDPERKLGAYGAILGAVRFAGAIRQDPGTMATQPMAVVLPDAGPDLVRLTEATSTPPSRWWMRDQVGWVRADVVPFKNPVPYRRGLQKLWMPPDEVQDACRRQLEEALKARGEHVT